MFSTIAGKKLMTGLPLEELLRLYDSIGMRRPKGVLQVGANNGQEIPYFIKNNILYGAFIEPLDIPFQLLQMRCAPVNGFLPVKALCGSVNGQTVDFHVSSNNGESSSLLPPDRHLRDYPQVSFDSIQKITTHTLDRIFESIAYSRPEIAEAVELLFMDVQGAELEVLLGGNAVLKKVHAIYTEVGLGGLYAGDVSVYDLSKHLKNYGFDIYWLEISKTGWGNAIYFKRTPGID